MFNKMKFAALAMVVSASAGTAVNACGDHVKTQSIVVPAETMTIQTFPAVVVPASEVLLPQTTTTTTVTRTKSIIVPTDLSSSSSVTMDSTMFMGPSFEKRLANMLDQINMGESRGWINSAEASALRSEHASYKSDELAAKADGFSRMEIDDLERKLTAFNITIHHALERHTAFAQ